ncbi:MAG: EAL domain-containing protein [Pseudomonadota bacterium]
MNADADPPRSGPQAVPLRLHRALLPDYNRKAATFWWTMVVLGTGVLAVAGQRVATQLTALQLAQVAIGVVMASLAGMFPLRIPGSKNSFAAGEIFIFTLLLLHGPAAATLASAGEALVGSWRTSKRWSSRIASPAMAAVAMFCAGALLEGALTGLGGRAQAGTVAVLLATTAFALVYFVLNTLLVTLVPRLKRNEKLLPSDLFGNFGWIGVAYSGSASVAVLVYLTVQHAGPGVLLAAAPIIALLLSTMHLFFRQQEAGEAMRRSQLDAMEREQEQARRHMQELQQIAFHDSLTSLPNRRRLLQLLEAALQRAKQYPDDAFALLFLDFDRFKLINDSLGHSAGDEFLVQVGRRLQEHVRPTDVVARLGGDEFAILVQGQGCADYAVRLAERLVDMLTVPVRLSGTEVSATASIGITSSCIGYQEASEVLRDADIAMYRAKAAGKARYALFDVGLRSSISVRMTLEAELRAVLAEAQNDRCGGKRGIGSSPSPGLSVEYQPLFSLATGQLIGFEALARWLHPRMGPVGPGTFVPIAEESGLIVELTDFVLHQACQQLKRIQAVMPGAERLTMHVNISSSDITHKGFVPRVTRAIAAAQLRPSQLTLELTENILMSSLEGALPTLGELTALGFRFSVDDFGTGASSLSHLSRLPVDSLKIDRSFVHKLDDPANAGVVKAIVFLAHTLGKTVVAEGIETAEQLKRLCAMGCEAGQGFHLSRALPGPSVEAALRASRLEAQDAPAVVRH